VAELENWREELEAVVQEARFLTQNLNDMQFNWHPTGDRWSMAQCFDHLDKVGLMVLPRMESEIAATPPATSGEFRVWRPTFPERLFIQTVGPNARFKVEVPKPYIPAPQGSVSEVMASFFGVNDRILACMEQAEGRDLRRIKIASPIANFLRLSLGAWFAATVAHTTYHVGQAKQAKAEPNFPSA
jgi:hypothetical protein